MMYLTVSPICSDLTYVMNSSIRSSGCRRRRCAVCSEALPPASILTTVYTITPAHSNAEAGLLRIRQDRDIHPRLILDSLLARDDQPRFAVHLRVALLQRDRQQLHLLQCNLGLIMYCLEKAHARRRVGKDLGRACNPGSACTRARRRQNQNIDVYVAWRYQSSLDYWKAFYPALCMHKTALRSPQSFPCPALQLRSKPELICAGMRAPLATGARVVTEA